MGQLDQGEKTLDGRILAERTGHRGEAHRHALNAQLAAQGAQGHVVVGDDGHVVPVTFFGQELMLDLPNQVVVLLVGGVEEPGLHTAVADQAVAGGQGGHRSGTGPGGQLAGSVGQRGVILLNPGDAQADPGSQQIGVGTRNRRIGTLTVLNVLCGCFRNHHPPRFQGHFGSAQTGEAQGKKGGRSVWHGLGQGRQAIDQKFRVGTAEGLYRLVRIAHQKKSATGPVQTLQQVHTGQGDVLPVVHDQQVGQILISQPVQAA